MIKTSIVLICGMTSVLAMDKTEFMRNGPALSATMTQQQRIEFMRNGRQISKHLSQQVLPKETPQETENTVETEKPLEQEENLPSQYAINDDVSLTENDLLNHVIKLSLHDIQPTLGESIQRADNASGKNIIVNYNVTIKQKLKYSNQNINIGNKNNN